jgi:hypothetical protein
LRLVRLVLAFLVLLAPLGVLPAFAVEAIAVRLKTPAFDVLPQTERYTTDVDKLQVSIAPGPDGIVRRIEVRARTPQGTTNWAVFALANNTDEQVDRLIVAPHYQMAGSGLFWPDLGSTRILAVTPSQGFRPERHLRSAPMSSCHARSGHDDHLRRRAQFGIAAAALSLGAGSLQGQGQQFHAL